MSDYKPLPTPISLASTLNLYDATLLDDGSQYRNTVGALQHCTLTRPNIAFVVNKVCQFMHSPMDAH